MKLTAFFLLAALLQVSAKTTGQTITYSGKDVSLEKVFTAIKKQTDYVFFYRNDDIQKAKKLTINLKDATLQEALDYIFKDQPLTYSIVDNTIVVKQKASVQSVMLSSIEAPPPIDITGRVTDADGNPLAGASVKVRGSGNGTTTNSNGVFVLKGIDENATLEISYVGYEIYTVAINNKTSIIASLKLKPENLNEVVINKGYYTERQRQSVANVGKVTSKDIEKQPVNNPLFALQGRVPGITVTQTSGLPGAGVVVRIQGQNSLNNGNGPLYVVDGVPISTEIPASGYQSESPLPGSGERYLRQNFMGRGNTLNFLNPSDIESIEVLKDADATAIYGSRAANGALLITTKKGKAGKPSLNLDLQHGFGQVGRFLKLLNTSQYIEMRKEALQNDGLTPNLTDPFDPGYAPDLLFWDSTRYTNWQKELIGGTAHYTHANASVSGGSSEVQYLIGGGYHRETTVFPGNFANQRGTMQLNVNNNADLSRKFHFQVSTNYSADENKLPRYDLTEIALTLVPNAPALYNADGTLNWQLNANGQSTFANPLAQLRYKTYSSKTNNLIANGNFSYDVLPGLKISTGLGFTNLQSSDIQKSLPLAEIPDYRQYAQRQSIFSDGKLNTWIIEPQLTYKKRLGKGAFDGLLGTTFQHTFREAETLFGVGFNSDQVMENPAAAPNLIPIRFQRSIYKYNAVFSRLNYVFDDKYILNLTGRRDGSTRFGSNNQFHNFWSVGAGWIFSQEKLLGRQSFLSFGKLKGSYGTTGSDQIGDYRFLSLYNIVNSGVPYQNISSLVPGDIPNPYLQWEETKKFNIGIDLGFLRDRIFLTANYARNRSSNQLIDYILPIITGRSNVMTNFPATIQNTNWEFTLNTENVKSKVFNWTTNVNLTLYRNKLVEFPDLEKTSYYGSYFIGEPVDVSQLLRSAGVDATTGVYAFVDSHGNSTTTPTTPDDLTRLFTAFPKYYGGFQNMVQFKGLQLDALIQFTKQKAFSPDFGLGYIPGSFWSYNSTGNQLASVMNRWQKPGDVTSIQKFSASDYPTTDAFYYARASDKSYIDASYVRLKNISLSWNLPSNTIRKLHLQNCRVFAQAQNLFTITDYKGLDPETPGYSTLPPLRVITFGLQLKL